MLTVIINVIFCLFQISLPSQKCFGSDVKQIRQTRISDMDFILKRLEDLDNVERKMADQERDLTQLQGKVLEMNDKMDRHEKDVSELRSTVQNLRLELTEKDKKIEYLMNNFKKNVSNKTIFDRIIRVNSCMTKDKNNTTSVESEGQADKSCCNTSDRKNSAEGYKSGIRQSSSIKRNKKRLLTGAQATPSGVAFSAYLDHTVSGLGQEQPIVFNRVLLDEGNNFNENTGMFRCPKNGVYLFIFHIAQYRQSAGEIEARLRLDGAHVVDAVSDPQANAHDQQGSNSAIIRCNAGQSVFVEAYRGQNIYATDTWRYTTFSGVFLY